VIRFVASPNADSRPEGAEVELLVLHAISVPEGEFSVRHVEALFTNRLDPDVHPAFAALASLRVSAHFLIDRGGGITQFVPVAQRAWHAGKSCWRGRERCNDFSVGIELLGDAKTPFTEAQYEAAARLARALMARFPKLRRDCIVGHADIAPGRKWDPGPQWDWQRFFALLDRMPPQELPIR